MSKRIKITDFLPDEKNFNKHSEYGMSLLQKSIEKVGVIESITVSADDKVITGNARQEKFLEVFGEEVQPIVVETDGKRPVVLKRTDINSGTKQFHEAALLANTVARKNINLDTELIREVLVEEFESNVEELGVEIVTTDFNGQDLPAELNGIDLTPDVLDKIQGDDSVGYSRIMIVYRPEQKEDLESILGIKIEKVVYKVEEINGNN
jgi:CMP-2-keto-3-deoxyoctulosonic acid synthetase